jgi:hypothetical protein
MRDVGLNLCDFFPKLFELFRIFGDGGLVMLDGVLNLATTFHLLHWLQIPHSAQLLLALGSFSCSPHLFHNFGCSNMESHVSDYQAANRLIETVIAPHFCRDRLRLEFARSGFLMIHAAQNTVGAGQTSDHPLLTRGSRVFSVVYPVRSLQDLLFPSAIFRASLQELRRPLRRT